MTDTWDLKVREGIRTEAQGGLSLTMMLVPRKMRESMQEELSHFPNTLTRVFGQCVLGTVELQAGVNCL